MAAVEGGAAAEGPADADVNWDTFSRCYPLKYDFQFAYDSKDFSDRILRLVIVPGEFRGSFELPRNRFCPPVFRSEIVASDSLADLEQGEVITDKQIAGFEKRIGVASNYNQPGNNIGTCKVSEGEVNGNTTCIGSLTNHNQSGVSDPNGLLSCGQVTSARSFSSSADLPPHQEIGMPPLSSTMTEGNIVKWLKKEGDKVSRGEVLCEVETDKATVKMECMEDGYLAKLFQGDNAKAIKLGEIICVTVKEEGDIEKFKDFKPSSSGLNGSLSSVQDGCNLKADNEECLGVISESSAAPPVVKRVRNVCINSAILAANSNVFFAMFSNGMRESSEKLLTFEIAESEEQIMLEVIHFLYSGRLSTTEPALLLDILFLAERFEVTPLLKHIVQLLTSVPMTVESAVMFVDYPYGDSLARKVDHLTCLARQFLVNTYKDLSRIPEELWQMPLAGIEAIFESNHIQVDSEDEVYDFLVKWVYLQYPDQLERDSVYKSNLLPLLRFCYMSNLKLEQLSSGIADCLHREETLKLINSALIGSKATSGQVQREYNRKPIRRVVSFYDPCPLTILYFDLTRDDCLHLFPDGQVYSHEFSFAGQILQLMASCQPNPGTNTYSLGLWVRMQGVQPYGPALTVELDVSSRERASGRFATRLQLHDALLDGETMVGGSGLFEPWPLFIADDNLFIDGVLHLKVDLSVVELIDL